jgi:cellulose synthase/poly-beta-1,6-N-acetylglucosamine synthase-like glycosyltransferase
MTALAIFYFAASFVLTAHTIFQFWLFVAARRRRNRGYVAATSPLPFVTVQLPIYNERFVVNRLLAAVARLEYPRDRLAIQVLDDSTDGTTALIETVCARLAAEGVPIEHVRRGDRVAFKAGALQYGLERTQDGLVAVFDADFLPAPNLLRFLVPHFADARVAAVQARWAFANRDESLLTRMQGFYIDVHFAVEQAGRSELDCFVNFNGTAGIWRTSAIRDAGGFAGGRSCSSMTSRSRRSYRPTSARFARSSIAG